MQTISYVRRCFRPELISHAVWPYFRSALSYPRREEPQGKWTRHLPRDHQTLRQPVEGNERVEDSTGEIGSRGDALERTGSKPTGENAVRREDLTERNGEKSV